jgi:hypothetical protein
LDFRSSAQGAVACGYLTRLPPMQFTGATLPDRL